MAERPEESSSLPVACILTAGELAAKRGSCRVS
jgi:hypothetical protein